MLFIIIQVAAMMAFRATIPRDLIFARDELDTPFRINFRRSILAAGSVSLILLLITILLLQHGGNYLQWDRYGLILLAAPFSDVDSGMALPRRGQCATTTGLTHFIRALVRHKPAVPNQQPSKRCEELISVCSMPQSTDWNADLQR